MIELQNLSKSYGTTEIFHQSNYIFPNTGFICLLGESGCGKTTLMRLIAGIDTTYTGNILVDQVPLHTLSEQELCNYRKDHIGFIFQDYRLLHGYSVLENVIYPCALKSSHPKKDIEQAKQLLESLGLSDKLNENVQNLSGGQKQRVAIARSLITNPNIILADEPTGALDRASSIELIKILKHISKTTLVILITHDQHICEYADEVITIKEGTICIEQSLTTLDRSCNHEMSLSPANHINVWKRSYKQFKTTVFRYLFVSIVFSIGILSIIVSLSSKNIMETSIQEFKEQNVALYNGYIKNDGIHDRYERLIHDERIENVYKQYALENISLSYDDHTELIAKKIPMPKTTESVSYGRLPRNEAKEIALTPSLAKKFTSQIDQLIGESFTLTYHNTTYTLTISGIYNAGYDDFFISSHIERDLYQGLENQSEYSISYDVKKFEDIVNISNELAQEQIQSENASEQVETMQNSFAKIQTLFVVISGMILLVSLFIVIMILIKMQSSRYRFVGLLYSLGFERSIVSKMIMIEQLFLSCLVMVCTTCLLIGMQLLASIFHLYISFQFNELIFLIVLSCLIIFLIHMIINRNLITTHPDIALNHTS